MKVVLPWLHRGTESCLTLTHPAVTHKPWQAGADVVGASTVAAHGPFSDVTDVSSLATVIHRTAVLCGATHAVSDQSHASDTHVHTHTYQCRCVHRWQTRNQRSTRSGSSRAGCCRWHWTRTPLESPGTRRYLPIKDHQRPSCQSVELKCLLLWTLSHRGSNVHLQ